MADASETNWRTLGTPGRNTYRVSDRVVDMRRPERPVHAVHLPALPQDLVIDLARTAIVVIDMVNDFCNPEGWVASMPIDVSPALALAGPINAATAALRAAGAPVVWVNWGVRHDRANLSPGTQHPFNPNGGGPGLAGPMTGSARDYHLLEKDSWGSQIITELVQDPRDIHVDKHRISGFWDTPLNAILQNLGVTTLLFAGVNADHCVLGTLMDANFHGYDTIFLEDCAATTSPDFCFQATLHNIRFCFGFTAMSSDLVTGIAAASAKATA